LIRKDDLRVRVNLIPPSRSRAKGMVGIAAISFVLGLMLGLVGFGAVSGADPMNLLTGNPAERLSPKTPSERLIAQGWVKEIAKKTKPSVVGIQTQQPSSGGPLDRRKDKQESESVGSGVIIRSDGIILTNSHVISGADKIVVTLGKEKLPATVVGADKDSDIAVIRVDRNDLPAAKLGSAGRLEVGELAVAIGSPFGFQRSVTAGVISALNRKVTISGEAEGPRTYTNLIQTDAAINPGNSGGALINEKGEVVGINTLIYSTNGVSQGVGFAIPVEDAQSVARDILRNGRANHPFIGIEGQTVDPIVAEDRNLKVNQGALVLGVSAGGPAEMAGVRVGDVITAFDNTAIGGMEDLMGAVRQSKIDRPVDMLIDRGGREKTLSIAPSARPDSF
jgi:S1-C subfamily serine protease